MKMINKTSILQTINRGKGELYSSLHITESLAPRCAL
jgi:hypothetical protein